MPRDSLGAIKISWRIISLKGYDQLFKNQSQADNRRETGNVVGYNGETDERMIID